MGVHKEDRVGVMLGNSIEYAIVRVVGFVPPA